MQPPITHVTIDNLKTAHAVIGEGDPVLLLHGWGNHIGVIWKLADALAEAGYRAYVLDLPGFGQTDLPPTAWDVHDYAAFVMNYLDNQNIEKTHLFGHSFGGRISIVLSANHPQRFEKVVLCDSAGVRPKAPWYRELPARAFRAVEGLVGGWPLVQSLRQSYRERVGSADYLQAGPLEATFLKIIAEDLVSIARQIQQPTLILWGANDTDTPLWMGQVLERTIPDAGLVIFQRAGHYSYLDALPDAVRVIDYFFTHDE